MFLSWYNPLLLKISPCKNYPSVSLPAKMGKIYGSLYVQIGGTPTFWSWTPTFSSGTPTFCQMGVLNSHLRNPIESSGSGNSVKWSGKLENLQKSGNFEIMICSTHQHLKKLI